MKKRGRGKGKEERGRRKGKKGKRSQREKKSGEWTGKGRRRGLPSAPNNFAKHGVSVTDQFKKVAVGFSIPPKGKDGPRMTIS